MAGPVRLLRVGLALAAAGALGACWFERAEPLSPGEIVVPPPAREQLQGEDNPTQQAIAVVVNRRDEVLVSYYRRIGRQLSASAPYAPDFASVTGGERAVTQPECQKIVEQVGPRSGLLPLRLVQAGFELAPAGQETLYGLRWTLPGGERKGTESALENALRVIAEQTGAPRSQMKQEFVHFDEQSQTAYFRFRYQGNPQDTFLFFDPARGRGRSYHVQSAWAGRRLPDVQLLMAYVELIDGLDAETTAKLFGQ